MMTEDTEQQLALFETDDGSPDVDREAEADLQELLDASKPLIASYEVVKAISEQGGYGMLVWAGEGEFKGTRFVFNPGCKGFKPLVLDGSSARAIRLVYEGLEGRPEQQEKMVRELAESRFKFAKWLEFCWGQVKFG